MMRTYSIGQAATIMGVAASTLRYYDKEGLLPFVKKNDSGIRVFRESDIEWLAVINCMKKAGAPLEDIKAYVDLCIRGDDSLQDRLDIFVRRKEAVQQQMKELKGLMETIEHKIWYYETAIAAGTESVHGEKCYSLEDLLE